MGDARHDRARFEMAAHWHNAAFVRSKRMPPLHRYIGDTERTPKSSGEIVNALKLKFGVRPDG